MIAILGIVVFVSFVGVGLVVPLFPFFGERAGAAPEAITTAMAVFAFGQLVSTPFWGWVSDRVGRKPVLVVSMLGAALSYLMLGLATSVEMLMLSRLVGGLMTGIGAVAFAMISDVASGAARARGMGRISAAFSLGFILGPAFGGLLAGNDPAAADFPQIAFAAAGIDVGAALLAAVFVRETRTAPSAPVIRPASKTQAMRPPAAAKAAARTGGVLLALRDPALRRLNLVNVLFAGSLSVVDSTLPLFASRVHNLGPREIGLAFTWMGVVSAVAQGTVLGRVVQAIGALRSVACGLACAFCGQLLLAVSPGPLTMAAGLALLACGMSLLVAPASSMVSAAAPDDGRGAALGVFQGAGNLGRTLIPPVAGLLFATVHGAAPFYAAALLLLPAAMLLRGADPRQHAADPPQTPVPAQEPLK